MERHGRLLWYHCSKSNDGHGITSLSTGPLCTLNDGSVGSPGFETVKLKQLKQGDKWNEILGYNRWAVASLTDLDHSNFDRIVTLNEARERIFAPQPWAVVPVLLFQVVS